MKKLMMVVALFSSVVAMPAFAGASCEDVKAQIAKKIDGKGVKNYTLEVVAKADVKDQKVVGHCGGGASKIVYARGAAKPAQASEAPAKPVQLLEAAPSMKGPSMKGPAMTPPAAAK